MAQTKRFITLQAQLVTDRTNEVAIEAGVLAVKAAYANQDPEMALSLLNDTPQFIRKAFATWLRGYGVVVVDPAYGTAEYKIGEGIVKDTKHQAKVFAAFATGNIANVLAQELKTRVEKKVKPLEGTAASRAQKKMESVIKALKKDDPEAGAFLNDAWTSKTSTTDDAFYDLTKDEESALQGYLMQLRMAKLKVA